MPKTENARFAETCCRHCYLLTRADFKKCLHCGKPLATPADANRRRAAEGERRSPQSVA